MLLFQKTFAEVFDLKQTAYKKVYSTLKQEIREGKYEAGKLLPPEHFLESRFEVSRTTVRRALELLARDGFVDSRQGRGTTVLDFTTVQRLNALTSMTETLKNKGYDIKVKGMHIDLVEVSAKVAKALMIKEGDVVVRIQRVQCANDQPIAIMTNYLLEEMVPGIEAHSGGFTSLYDFLETQYNLVLTNAIEYLSASVADFSESQILGVPVGWALLISTRVTYSDNRPVEYAHTRILGDKYRYAVHLEGRP